MLKLEKLEFKHKILNFGKVNIFENRQKLIHIYAKLIFLWAVHNSFSRRSGGCLRMSGLSHDPRPGFFLLTADHDQVRNKSYDGQGISNQCVGIATDRSLLS